MFAGERSSTGNLINRCRKERSPRATINQGNNRIPESGANNQRLNMFSGCYNSYKPTGKGAK
jgi:hypothetical protein